MRTKVSGGSSGIPGVSSDRQTPGGEIIAGSLTAGYPVTDAIAFHALYGSAAIESTQPSLDDADDTFSVLVTGTLSANNSQTTLVVKRDVVQDGHNFSFPLASFDDESTSDVPIADFSKQSVSQFTVNLDGVTIHNKIRTGASVPHSLGSYSGNAVPIYDESGTLLGYMPLYA